MEHEYVQQVQRHVRRSHSQHRGGKQYALPRHLQEGQISAVS